jgi:hypothetical protein
MRRAARLGLLGVACSLVFVAACSSHGTAKAFCDSVRTGENPLDVFNRYDPADAAAKDQLQAGVQRLQVLQKAAPGDLRDSVATLVDVASKLEAALDPQARDHPPFDVDQPALQKASSKVVDYAASNCGVDLTIAAAAGPGATTTTAAPPASTSG